MGVECLLTEMRPGGRDDRQSALLGRSGLGAAPKQCGLAEVEEKCNLPSHLGLSHQVQFKPEVPVKRVAGGQSAAPGSLPWTASVRVRGSSRSFHWCGAVVVSSLHLLTAAHCMEDYPKDRYEVRVGDWDQDTPDTDEQKFSLDQVG